MTDALHAPVVRLDSFATDTESRSFSFSGFERVISTVSADQVVAALQQVEEAVAAGLHAAGFISYEAGAAINPELPAAPGGDLPLVWFGLFRERQIHPPDQSDHSDNVNISSPTLAISRERYGEAFASIKDAIAAGQTYQINFTVRQNFDVTGDPLALYRRICRNQQAPYGAFIDTGKHQILSASPELFFALHDGVLTMRPMKGTAERLPNCEQDQLQKTELQQSEKNRAENLMIVDLIRNDLARIAETGSVKVEQLFAVETYPTVHQMTSAVTAQIAAGVGLTEVFRALFPCGSVTGAPKRRTMQLISELERAPRGVYCGAIGYVSPGNEALFSVAIRTAVIENATGRGELGIGSGITWDSEALSEYEECLLKGRFLTRKVESFSLIESIRHDSGGYLLLERHLQRLAASARYFGFRYDLETMAGKLSACAKTLSGVTKVRLLVCENGNFTIAAEPLVELPREVVSPIAISGERVDPADRFLYHKTTRRTLYEQALHAHPDCYDVIFANLRDEVTEGCFNTIVLLSDGKLLTPGLECGILPGVLRQELLEIGAVCETVITLDELHKAEKIWLINSVRGWRECRLLSPDAE